MIGSLRRHVKHHARFYASLSVGVVVAVATAAGDLPVRPLAAGDAFFAVYVVSMAVMATRASADDLRRRSRYEDEGIVLIVLITLAAIVFSIGSIFDLFAHDSPDALPLALGIASVPLGWLTLHTIAAFHYAHLYYAPADIAPEEGKDVGALAFPETDEPTGWDFLYYSFVVGMTAQVSDVVVRTSSMRRLTLAHSVVSFFYNAVILALAVNLVVNQG